ncbi:mannitol dehydrogenase family protein [Xylophilus sp.]|uniref:mannitol dehydrogenase family protein n=1 Tax=Xylophilus sp. TaxID=2653893 RepID=UPI002D803C50|nr:mannitol dehydrogenase family protein [Xylophilus sp.]
MTRLTNSSAARLPASVRRPAYDRAAVRPGIVHLGLGAFHRAHQALYTEQVLAGGDLRWGIVGVHLRGRRLADALAAQDHLYTITEQHAEQSDSRLVGAIQAALFAPEALEKVLGAIADPQVHVVTSTVTEKGYSLLPATGELDLSDADLAHDLQQPQAPRSTLGVLAAGLLRRDPGAPLTVVCCDNMAANGPTLRRLLGAYAERACPALLPRLSDGSIAFPSTMVDRIVPAATEASLAAAEARLGLRDELAIACEPFTQWVIENAFAGPRPAWEQAGALFTSDVRPFQEMKLRLLNGSHSAIAYLGQLRGRETVAGAMADPVIRHAVRAILFDELLPTVAVPAGFDVRAYGEQLIHRFDNPALAHRTAQIAMDGTQKVAVRWLPALRERLAQGRPAPRLERALAAWLHTLRQAQGDAGQPLALGDPGAPPLVALLRAAASTRAAADAALGYAPVFGTAPWPACLAARLAAHLDTLAAQGTDGLLASVAA